MNKKFLSLLIILSAQICWSMANSEINFAQRALLAIEGREVSGDILKNPEDLVSQVKSCIPASWPAFPSHIRATAEKMRQSGRNIDELIKSLREIRTNPGELDFYKAPPVDMEVLRKAPRIMVLLNPMNGLNIALALKEIQKIMEVNPSVSGILINRDIPTLVKDHNELVELIKRLELKIDTLPINLPEDSLKMYLWAAPQILNKSASLSIVDSEARNLPAVMTAFKDSRNSIQSIYFATNSKQGILNKDHIFPNDPNVHMILIRPEVEMDNKFYGKFYAEDELQLELYFVLKILTEIENTAKALIDSRDQ